MKFSNLSQDQAAVIVQAMYAVVSASGGVQPQPIEIECIQCIQRHLLGLDLPCGGQAGPLPATLASVLDTPRLRRNTVRVLAMLPTVDRQVSPRKVAVVEEAAASLGVSEFGLVWLHNVAHGKSRRVGITLMKRFINYYWSYTGKAGLRDWAAVMWTMMPWLPGLRRYLRLDEVLGRYQGLAGLPSDSVGHAVYRYYSKNGFPMPGEPKSIPEGWARHEVYHVLANYNTNLQGELLLAGFIAGNTERLFAVWSGL